MRKILVFIAVFLVLFCVVAQESAADSIVVWRLKPQAGVTDKEADTISGIVTAEIGRASGKKAVGEDEMKTLITGEEMKMSCGANDSSCVAEISAAMGAPESITGTISKIGDLWILTLQRLNVRKVEVISRYELKTKGDAVSLIEKIPYAAKKLFVTEKSKDADVSGNESEESEDLMPSEPKEKDFKDLLKKSGRKMRQALELKIPGKALGILPFDTSEKDKGVMLSDIYAYYLTGGNFKLLDRKELDKALAEIQLSYEMITEKKNASKLGSMTGADFLQSGNMTQFEDSYYINVKVIDIATGESVYIDSVSFKNRDFRSTKDINDLIPEKKYPVNALFRSALIPGWGQFYNDKPVKGGIFLGLHVALAATTITFACLHWDDNSNSEDPKVQQKALDEGNRNKYVFAGAVSALGVNLIISMIDAYVDAKRSK